MRPIFSDPDCPELLLQSVKIEDAPVVQSIFYRSDLFFLKQNGKRAAPDQAALELTRIPVSTHPSQKKAFVLTDHHSPIGFSDLYLDYPKKNSTFLSILLLAEEAQGLGFGCRFYGLIERYLREHTDTCFIRLGIADLNPVFGFWKKLGFRYTKDCHKIQFETKSSSLRIFEKKLESSDRYVNQSTHQNTDSHPKKRHPSLVR